MTKVSYVDLSKQNSVYINDFKKIFTKFIKSGNYILGDYVKDFEENFSNYIGVNYSIGVGSGTDALYLSLKALGISKNDEVITVANSYLSSASSILLAGAKPIFVDISDDLNINPDLIKKKISKRTKAIILVHLTGNPADIKPIKKISSKYKIPIIEDAAQAVGASINNKKVGSFGIMACFSFHPLKNLNAFGDAGIITTNNKKLANFLIKARNHGHPYRDNCDFWSHNMRIDAIQAAFLQFKLKNIEKINNQRINNASFYNKYLTDKIQKPIIKKNIKQVFHTYIIKTNKRDDLLKYLSKKGIDTKIHYPIPIHKMTAYKRFKYKNLIKTEMMSKKILSLPISEYLTINQKKYVVDCVNSFFS